jgi:protein-S-isoprenylcysteine O-methyltransferase Ste14
MDKVILFIALSIPVILLSRKSLFDFKSHGFTRFFSWECIIALFVINYEGWFMEPFSAVQIISWLMLSISLYLVTESVIRFRKASRNGIRRVNEKLYRFEKTTELVTKGIYRYIRHPMYSSLLFLTWGIWLKQPIPVTLPVALLSSLLLWLTAIRDEKECIAYFGDSYHDYIKGTKRFIPFIL